MKLQRTDKVWLSIFSCALLIIIVPIFLTSAPEQTIEIEPLDLHVDPVEFSEVPKMATQETVNRAELVREIVDKDGYLFETGTRIGEPVLSEDIENAKQWAIRVSTVDTENEADAIRSVLAEQGFNSWSSHRKNGDHVVIDIGVGPFMLVSERDMVYDQLLSIEQINPILVGFEI